MRTIITGLIIGSCLFAFSDTSQTDQLAGRPLTDNVSTSVGSDMLSAGGTAAQKTYRTNKGHVSFFSEAPVSDVDARNDRVKISLDGSTGELNVNITMSDFKFQNKKMGRDARRKYIEIDEFPHASFIGKISGKIDYGKPGSYPVIATGTLKVHGVEQDVSEKGTLKVEEGKIKIASEFTVALKDHNIETPKILGLEMTENSVVVKVEATLSPSK